MEEPVDSPGRRTADSAKSVPQSSAPQTFAETREEWEKQGESSSHTQTVLKSPVYGQSEVQDTVGQTRRTPSPVGRSPTGKLFPVSFSSFSVGEGMGKSGPGGGSSIPGGPPGGPPGGGGDPDGGYSGGRGLRFGDLDPAARPLAVGALRLEAPPRYQGGMQPGVRAWLREMARWISLMDYPQRKWIDIVATRTEGAANSWLTHEQDAMARRTDRKSVV